MSLRLRGYIELPAHKGDGGFDHAAVHRGTGRMYVAHTANDALEVVETGHGRHVKTVGTLGGVAGALVSEEKGLVFTSNRAEDTVSILAERDASELTRVRVGVHPNGLAFDAHRNLLLAANVGDAKRPDSHTVSFVDVAAKEMTFNPSVPGRTRWAVYDPKADAFYVNIRDPPEIVVLQADDPSRIARTLNVPAAGPHGLDLDDAGRRLFCACDDGRLVTLDTSSGDVLGERALSGTPDVVFFNPSRRHLYVAIGDPGVIDVFDTETMDRIESIETERGAHTMGFDAERDRVYALLPGSHRAAVLDDSLEA